MISYSIGIVVPVYKVKKDYLEYCVNSLISQTYTNIRIVLVDDASPDECGMWCDEMAKWDERITVFHHEVNKGLPGARNTGVSSLETDYVIFVDADDWIEKNSCELLNAEINERIADVYLYSGFLDYRDKTIKCQYIYDHHALFVTEREKTNLESRYLLDQTRIHVDNSFPVQSANCRMVSTKLFKEKGLRFTEIRFAEDAIFHLDSTEIAASVEYLRYNLYHYRNTAGSMINSYRPNCDSEQISVMNALWNFSERNNKDKYFFKQLYYVSFVSMQMCIWQKYFNENNKDQFLKRRRECLKLFKKEPYHSTLKHISFRQLRTNQKVKYLLMRLTMYNTMVKLRNINKRHIGELSQ